MKSPFIAVLLGTAFSLSAHAEVSYDCRFRKLDRYLNLVSEIGSLRITPPTKIGEPNSYGKIGEENGVAARASSYFLPFETEDYLDIRGQQKLLVAIRSEEVYQELVVNIDTNRIARLPLDSFTKGFIYRVECLLKK